MFALALGGCGGRTPTPQALRLERADLAQVAHALARAEPLVGRELAATKLAWRDVVNGLPARPAQSARAAIAAASARAGAIGTPGIFEERVGATLTGPGAQLASEFRTFSLLTARGWRLIVAALQQREHAGAPAARFASANAGLYIESVYDGHFALAQIGRQLRAGYRKLGAARAFGPALSAAEVARLAATYSEAHERLHPHPGVRFGA